MNIRDNIIDIHLSFTYLLAIVSSLKVVTELESCLMILLIMNINFGIQASLMLCEEKCYNIAVV